MLLPQLSQHRPDLVAPISSMPCLRHVLKVRLGETVVAVMSEKASQSYSITKLNSGLEFHRGLVDHVLDLYRLDGLTPFKESFGCESC